MTRGNPKMKEELVESPCLSCNKPVRTNDYAVQCEKCDGWMHCGCANISLTLYKCLIQTKSTVIHIDCSSCRPTEQKVKPIQSDISEGSESEYESLPVDHDSTCIRVTPVSVSTPVKPVSTLQPENESLPKTYADVVGLGSPSKTLQPSGEKTRKRQVRPRVQDLINRIQSIEENLLRSQKRKAMASRRNPDTRSQIEQNACYCSMRRNQVMRIPKIA